MYCCGNRHMPHVLVAVYAWGDSYVDVVNVRGADRVTAARLPNSDDDLDIFAPHEAAWHYVGALRPTVTALLRLPPPRPSQRANNHLPSAAHHVRFVPRAAPHERHTRQIHMTWVVPRVKGKDAQVGQCVSPGHAPCFLCGGVAVE